MKLHYRTYGDQHAAQPPLVLLHGLFGSGANWHGIANALAETRRVLVPDLRNHGRSPHDDDVSYPAMANDLLAWLDELAIEQACLIGHSMGAKAAMYLALEQGDRVAGLVSVDMAPVRYPDRFAPVYAALEALPLKTLKDRREAELLLSKHLADAALRAYLLQNLLKQNGDWRWRINLTSLSVGRQQLFDFPATKGQFLGSVLFLRGGNSDYVLPEHGKAIRQYFPYARERTVAGAGHWVYAEQGEAFLDCVQQFLSACGA